MENPRPSGSWLWPIAALAVYAAFYFLLLYQPGLVRMDDFAYLRGIAETLASGRLHTDDWLAPYSATLSALGSFAYLITGNFPLSTWGLEAFFALANAVLLYTLLRRRLEAGPAAALALLLATQPVYAHKTSEFAGNLFTLTFAAAALLAWSRNRPAWFFPFAFLAFANRQNALALLALPAFDLLFTGPSARRRWALAAGLAGFAVAALCLHAGLNRTFAQAHSLYAGLDPARIAAILRCQSFGACAALSLLSAFSLLTGADARGIFIANLRRPALPAAATLIFWALPWIGALPLVSFLTPLIGSLDRAFALQRILMALIPVLLWTLDWRSLRMDGPFFLVAAYVLISGMLGYWYDFYLIDIALAALFYRLSRPGPMRIGKAAAVIMAFLFAAHLAWAYAYKVFSDKQRISVAALEGLERQGRIGPAQMTDGTFGYLAWKLFAPSMAQRPFVDLAYFQCYVERGRAVVETQVPWRRAWKEGTDGQAIVLAEGEGRIGFMRLPYRVRDLGGTGLSLCHSEPVPLESAYRPEPFPLNRSEWDAYIRSLRALPAPIFRPPEGAFPGKTPPSP